MSSVALEQYPCDAVAHNGVLFVGLSSLTGEHWRGSLLVRAGEASHVLPVEHGVAALAAVGQGDDYVVAAATDASELQLFTCHKAAARLTASLPGHGGPVSSVAALSGDRVVSSSQDMRSIVWDVAQRTLTQVFDLHGGAISLTAASGDVFATFSGFDRQLHVFKVGEESPIHSLTTPSEASGLSFSPDGSSLLVGLYSGAALTYDLKQFKEPRERCAHHTAALRRFAFLGNSVISAGDDHVARVWGSDVAVRHGDFVRGLAVQEGALVTASWDKTLRVTKL